MSGIKSLRLKAKVTQGELAALIASSQGAVSHYETGRRIPDIDVGKRIVSAFKQLGYETSLDEVFSDDGQRQMVANNEYVHDAIVLNSATGLIGMPQQTIGNGVNVRALINPNIRVNGLIQLDQASVFRTALSNNDIAMAGGQITDQNTDGNITLSGTTAQPASIATDGVYIVRGIMYTGDTRGQAWYMDMMCEARGAADLVSSSARERGL